MRGNVLQRAFKAIDCRRGGIAARWLMAPLLTCVVATAAFAAGDSRILQQDILDGLARGEDVSTRLQQFQAQGSQGGAISLSDRSTRVARFSRQSQSLHRLIATLSARPELKPDDIQRLQDSLTLLRAEHLLFQQRFEGVGRQLATRASGGVQQRHAVVYSAYLETVGELIQILQAVALPEADAEGPLTPALQQQAKAAMADASPLLERLTARLPRRILRNSLLPFGPSALATRAPRIEPVIVPTYEAASTQASGSDDLKSTAEAPLSQEILARAKALDYDYIRIFDFVRGQVKTEWYAGSMKGATGTLRQLAGNDVDQASLLIALLRASGLPTRYVHGVIELPIESLLESLALEEPLQAVQALAKAGIAHSPQIRGGRIAVVQIEHSWVSAYMPYTNYRGAVVDSAGKSWLPLFPALKANSHQASTRILETMNVDLDAIIDDYLFDSQADSLLASLRSDVETYLEENDIPESYKAQLGATSVEATDIGLIPHSLPVAVVAVTREQAALDDADRQTVQFIVRRGTRDNAEILLDYQLPVAQLASERVTLSYLPATEDDQAIVNQFGGLDSVPAYLVQLRPQIKLNGRLKRVGVGGLDMASKHRFEILLHGPNGTELIAQEVTTGGYHAIAVQAGAYAPTASSDNPADTEFQAAQLLNRLAQTYSSDWHAAEDELAGLLDVAVVRPAPSIAIASSVYTVDSLLGQPLQLEFTGVSLDAAYRTAQPLARDASDTTAADWMRLAALQGSTLEAKVFRDLFLVDAISADLGLRRAAQQSIPILSLDGGNIDTLLPGLLHAPEVLENLRNWVRLGLTVTIPQSEISYNAWQGSVWRVQDANNGAAGYFISGGLAGGASTELPAGWLLSWLAQALTSANGALANNNALSVSSLNKLPSGDGQEGPVDNPLPQQLQVEARDVEGTKVAGAEVTFTVVSGGGQLADPESGEGAQQVTVFTNASGIASVTFSPGQLTAASPRFKRINDSDKYYTRVGLNIVDATAESYHGPVIIEAPFSALGLPGEVTQVIRTGAHKPDGVPNRQVDVIRLQLLDEFTNPVSNAEVQFQISENFRTAEFCPEKPDGVLPGAIFENLLDSYGDQVAGCPSNPVLGECGSPSTTLTSSVIGVSAGVILGNTNMTEYTVNVSTDGFDESYEYRTPFICRPASPRIVLAASGGVANGEGESITAARAGEAYKNTLNMRVMLSVPEFEDWDAFGIFYSTKINTYPVNATVSYDTSNGGSTGSKRHTSEGQYQFKVTTGQAPGVNEVTAEIRDIVGTRFLDEVTDFYVNLPGGNQQRDEKFDEYIEKIEDFFEEGMDQRVATVYGLEPTVTEVISPVPPGMTPGSIFVNDDDQAEYGADIIYRIDPADYPDPELNVSVNLYEDGALHESFAGVRIDANGNGVARIIRSTQLDPEKQHEAEVVLSPGSINEVISDPFELTVGQRIFSEYPRSFISTMDIDTLNNKVCTQGTIFRFKTSQQARVTLEFTDQDNEDNVYTFIDDDLLGAGDHEYPISPIELPSGSYSFELKGVSTSTDLTEIQPGGAYSHYSTQDRLPVGHTLVKGVNVYTGGLSLGQRDLSLPGRGVALDFNRSYSSLGSEAPGALGYGWSHNYDSRVIITPCGEAIVIGAQGGGMRFEEGANGELKPLKGYHGTLVANQGDLASERTFDFYPKDGTRYHYVNHGRSEDKEWNLEYIEDTNGNITEFGYDPGSSRRALLAFVEDPVGRRLNFTWGARTFENFDFEPIDVIVAIDGPDGMGIEFEYDEFGNLIRAAREGDSRVQTYIYSTDEDDFDLRHKLTRYIDPNGHETRYDYNEGELVVTQDSITYQLPMAYTTEIVDPEGGITRFNFSKLNGTDTTTVTNGRNFNTRYTMNDYGSVVSIVDPVGTTSMTWATEDVLMTSRTDANGARTTYSHDAHGNVLEENVTGVDGSYTITRSYGSIDGKPWIKNRLATQSDRNGEVTQYDYDTNGNLVETVDAESNITTYSYFPNGDRASMRDPNGNDSLYRYSEDHFGNLSETIDALGNSTKTDWNERSLPIERTDANGHKTEFEYDTLNRLTVQTDTSGNTREFDYDPVGNKLSVTDEEGRVTRWTYDDENRVKTHTDALENTMSYGYDEVGNRTSQTDWRGNPTTFTYDTADRLVTQTEPLGKITSYTYDPVGNRLTQTDAEGRISSYVYDLLNREIEMNDAEDGVTRIEHDGVNRVAVIDPLGRKTDFTYDKINRLLTQTEPLGRVSRFTYDANGNRLSATDANGHTQHTEYDALNRPVRTRDALNNETRFDYDPVGNRIRVIDARLNESHVEYDELNRPVLSRDAGGFATSFEYDKVGNQTSEIWANGNVIETKYDDLNRPLSQKDSLGPISTATYDENGNRLSETDANGNSSIHTYDELNRLTQSDLPETRTFKFGYDLVGNRTSETDARGYVTRYDYDDLNRVVTVTDALGQTELSTYDPVGNRLSTLDRRSNLTRFKYDDLNRLELVADALGQTLSNRYDPVGNKISDTDKRGTDTDYAYDELNRPLRVTKDNVLISSSEYDEVGNVKFNTDANGNITGFIYDARNLLVTESRPLAAISQFSYDPMGDRLTAHDPEGRTSTTEYDLRRRTVSESNALGETTRYQYDGNGNRIGSVRPLGNAWLFTYDGADRLTEITDAEGGVTRYAYDGNSNKTSQTDANDNVTAYGYDVLNRQLTTTYADGANERYDYDENGNRTELTDAKGQVFTYSYDEINRETLRNYPAPLASSGDDIQSITTDYDANNNPITITETYSGVTGTRVTTKSYDNFDRLQSVTDAFGKTLGYSYDANGNRTRLSDPDGKLTQYRYDELNRLVDVITADGSSRYQYDRSSLQTRVTYPNGTSAVNRFDNARRIEQIQNRQGAAIISQYDYSYDSNGNRTSQIEINGTAAETTSYTYDNNDRLLQVDYPDSVVDYTHDANYNRLTEQSTDKASGSLTVNKTSSYDDRNQLESVADNIDASQNVIYQFDLNGNQTIKSKNGVITTFIYDVRDQLTGVREDATTLGQYFYDYQGMRVAKTGDNGLVRYTYDDNSVLLQFDGAGNTLAKYEYGPDRLLSLDHASEGRQFYHFDALGSTVHLSKPDATIQARYRYDAWGNLRGQSGESFNDFTFTGHEKDTETNLYYFKARYYDPDTGRFLSQDPYLGEAGTPPSLHRYLYAYSNPTVYWDLTGYEAVKTSYESEDNVPAGVTYREYRGKFYVVDREAYGSDDDTQWRVNRSVTSGSEDRIKEKSLFTKAIELFMGESDPYADNRIIQEKSDEPGSGGELSETERIERDFGGLGRAAERFADGASATADVIDLVVTPDEADVAIGIGTLGTGLIANKINKLRKLFRGEADEVVGEFPQRAITNLPQSYFDDLATSATRNINSNRFVLGKGLEDGKSYTKVAAHYEASYFKLDDWRSLSRTHTREEIWKVNESFIDQQLKAGKEVILSHDPSNATGFYRREVQYLEDLGYNFVQDGWVWRATK